MCGSAIAAEQFPLRIPFAIPGKGYQIGHFFLLEFGCGRTCIGRQRTEERERMMKQDGDGRENQQQAARVLLCIDTRALRNTP